jgi:TPR repeat protein
MTDIKFENQIDIPVQPTTDNNVIRKGDLDNISIIFDSDNKIKGRDPDNNTIIVDSNNKLVSQAFNTIVNSNDSESVVSNKPTSKGFIAKIINVIRNTTARLFTNTDNNKYTEVGISIESSDDPLKSTHLVGIVNADGDRRLHLLRDSILPSSVADLDNDNELATKGDILLTIEGEVAKPRDNVENAFTSQLIGFRITAIDLYTGSMSYAGLGYAVNDIIQVGINEDDHENSDNKIYISKGIFVNVTEVDDTGAVLSGGLVLQDPSKIYNEDVSIYNVTDGGTGSGISVTIDTAPYSNSILADIDPISIHDYAYVLQDETHAGECWRYSYDEGEGVPMDKSKAAQWLQKAADQDNANAQTNLGFMYLNGEGVPMDKSKAAQWYQKAADQGYAIAQNNLGILYKNGEVVPTDKSKAAQWFQKAADQGHAGAQYNLGLMYSNGEGVPMDKSKAAQWYQKAADQGYAIAQNTLGILYNNGDGVPMDKSKAAQWYQKAADQDNADALANLGFMYSNGEGVPTDKSKAAQWYQKAADQGEAYAQNNLGLMYLNGEGVPTDTSRAAQLFQKAADQGVTAGLINLARMYARALALKETKTRPPACSN